MLRGDMDNRPGAVDFTSLNFKGYPHPHRADRHDVHMKYKKREESV